MRRLLLPVLACAVAALATMAPPAAARSWTVRTLATGYDKVPVAAALTPAGAPRVLIVREVHRLRGTVSSVELWSTQRRRMLRPPALGEVSAAQLGVGLRGGVTATWIARGALSILDHGRVRHVRPRSVSEQVLEAALSVGPDGDAAIVMVTGVGVPIERPRISVAVRSATGRFGRFRQVAETWAGPIVSVAALSRGRALVSWGARTVRDGEGPYELRAAELASGAGALPDVTIRAQLLATTPSLALGPDAAPGDDGEGHVAWATSDTLSAVRWFVREAPPESQSLRFAIRGDWESHRQIVWPWAAGTRGDGEVVIQGLELGREVVIGNLRDAGSSPFLVSDDEGGLYVFPDAGREAYAHVTRRGTTAGLRDLPLGVRNPDVADARGNHLILAWVEGPLGIPQRIRVAYR